MDLIIITVPGDDEDVEGIVEGVEDDDANKVVAVVVAIAVGDAIVVVVG